MNNQNYPEMSNEQNLNVAKKFAKESDIRSLSSTGLSIADFLSSLKPFDRLAPQEVEQLASQCRFGSVKPGEYITVEGADKSLYGFVVVSGRLAMTKTSISGKELIVELLAPGDIFGLLLTLSPEQLPVQLSARSHGHSQVLWLPVQNLITFLNSNPLIYRIFVSRLLHHLHSSYQLSRGFAHDRVSVRIATVLVSLAHKFSRPGIAEPDHTIDITRQQIADLTGTTAETAIRVTRAMQRQKLIDIQHPGIVQVVDMNGLQLLAESE
jgi:CRP-like cAMP-binding protein